jgi:hypothetical protein
MASAAPPRISAAALTPMKHKLGIDTFRSGQLECINALALHGRDAWVGFACGGGKSLVFAAAMLLLGGVGILIEPLNAISTAMSTYLLARAVKTILLDGTKAARASAVAALLGDPDQPPVVIIGSPESVLHPAILAAMRSPIERGDKQRILCSLSDASLKNSMTSRVSLIGIDEAHTVSQWSVRFRPHFARLGELRAAVETWDYNSAPICAMTATATPAVRSAVKISIGFNDEGAVEEIQSLCRPNVAIYVHAPGNVSGKRTNAAAKAERVVHALHNPGVVLVFVSTLRATTAVANVISFAILTSSLGIATNEVLFELCPQIQFKLASARRTGRQRLVVEAVQEAHCRRRTALLPARSCPLRACPRIFAASLWNLRHQPGQHWAALKQDVVVDVHRHPLPLFVVALRRPVLHHNRYGCRRVVRHNARDPRLIVASSSGRARPCLRQCLRRWQAPQHDVEAVVRTRRHPA